jgi:hypothetical protein
VSPLAILIVQGVDERPKTRYDTSMKENASTFTVFPADPRLAAVRDYDRTFTTLEAAEDYCDELEGRGVGPLAIREG